MASRIESKQGKQTERGKDLGGVTVATFLPAVDWFLVVDGQFGQPVAEMKLLENGCVVLFVVQRRMQQGVFQCSQQRGFYRLLPKLITSQ